MKLFCLPNFTEFDFDKWGELIDKTNLSDIEKEATRSRVITVVTRLRGRLAWLTWAYNILRTTTTIGSVLVPSLLAFQNEESLQVTSMSMWGVGLAVTLSNAFMSLYRVDKNYYTIGTLLEKIESEAWMFLTQCGFYEQLPIDGMLGEGHRGNFQQFMERCELLINKAVRTEFTPPHNQRNGNSSAASISSGQLPQRQFITDIAVPRTPLRQANVREIEVYREHERSPRHADLDQDGSVSEVVDISVDEHPYTDNSNHRYRSAVRTPRPTTPRKPSVDPPKNSGGVSESDGGEGNKDEPGEGKQSPNSENDPPLKIVVR